MAKATEAVREPRFWKITVNPEECPHGAWAICRSTGLAMLGLPGEQAESGYAVQNMKRVREGDWLVAYTPQEGAYSVGGIGRVTRGYQCELGPFEHPWNGPVRRSLAVEWQAGACRIADLVKEGRFRKGKIARVLDEISAEEFACVRERVEAAPEGIAEPRPGAQERRGAKRRPAARVLPEPATAEPVLVLQPAGASLSPPPRPSPMVMDPRQEQPPLPEFFIQWTKEEKILGPDIRAGCGMDWSAGESPAASARERNDRTASTVEAALSRSREAHLLSSFSALEESSAAAGTILEFGLPSIGDAEASEEGRPSGAQRMAPSEVRVGVSGWTGLFRREVESGRPCCLLLRGPQYSFLNMTPSGTTLRGLSLFALFAIGAVAAPGKEAYRSGATFIFRGRRASGDYEVEVRPRRAQPAFREPAELAS
jgi:hypothetical protein